MEHNVLTSAELIVILVVLFIFVILSTILLKKGFIDKKGLTLANSVLLFAGLFHFYWWTIN